LLKTSLLRINVNSAHAFVFMGVHSLLMVPSFVMLQHCRAGCNFCVAAGSANAEFFAAEYAGLNVVPKPSIAAQIDGVRLNQGCDAAELAYEDLLAWGKNINEIERCKIQIVGPSVVKRPRGMLGKLEKQCVVSGMNALYHAFSIQPTDNAHALYTKWFPNAVCTPDAALNSREGFKIELPDLLGPFVLLGAVVTYTLLHYTCYRRYAAMKVSRQKEDLVRTDIDFGE
jgi:hypothetical protein